MVHDLKPAAIESMEINSVNQLILSYLVHSGYQETARTFFKDTIGARAALDNELSTFDTFDSTLANRKCN